MGETPMLRGVAFVLALWLSIGSSLAAVKVARVPEGGLQPQVVARDGVVHLIYLVGDVGKPDIRYSRSTDDGATWSSPITVNDEHSRGIAAGTVRGPHLAMGRDGILHVGWMSSEKAMFYARLKPGEKAFETPQNVVKTHPGLDGGGSVAADDAGHVYIAWHAPADKPKGDEASRKLWMTTSSDDGQTFSAERAIFDRPTGACACCAVRVHASHGNVFVLYRAATEMSHRSLFLLTSTDHAEKFRGQELAPMNLGICLMSTSAFVDSSDKTFAAWETKGKLSWGLVDPATASVERVIAMPKGTEQKHPAMATGKNGEILTAWTEGTRFGKGGSLAWQVYDSKQQAIADQHGSAHGVPAFDLPAAFATADGNYVILY